MVNYEQDVIAINDGDIVEIGNKDIIIGMKDDATEFIVLRWIAKR